MVRQTAKWGRVLGVLVLLVLTLSGAGGRAQAQASSRYFPETNHTVKDLFLSYWNGNGALAQQGYPINDEVPEVNAADGKTYTTQYFERSRFELHPEVADPNFRVLLGLLGREALFAKYPGGKVTNTPVIVPGEGSRFFTETGHTVTGLFLKYWSDHGGLRQQGLPLTEAFIETNEADGKQYLTQYFERARFEYHPEQSNPEFKVLLGLVGKEIYLRKQSGGLPPAGATTATATATVKPNPTSSPAPNPNPTATPRQGGGIANCQIGLYQVFQYAIDHSSGLKPQLGCPTSAGAGFEKHVKGGLQTFRYGRIVIVVQPDGVAYAYGLSGDGTFRRIETTPIDDGNGGDPPKPGNHFGDAWSGLGGFGNANGPEDYGDGAVQDFQSGRLVYVGSATQLIFAFFPANAPSGTWSMYESRPRNP